MKIIKTDNINFQMFSTQNEIIVTKKASSIIMKTACAYKDCTHRVGHFAKLDVRSRFSILTNHPHFLPVGDENDQQSRQKEQSHG